MEMTSLLSVDGQSNAWAEGESYLYAGAKAAG